MSRVRVLVIDGQGGGLGRQLTAALAAGCPDIELTAVGTNSIAASAMLKAGAHRAATGENAVVVNCRRADIIVGPIGIVIADSLLGEITPAMAAAVCQSSAARVLIPINHCDNIVVGVPDQPIGQLVAAAVEKVPASQRLPVPLPGHAPSGLAPKGGCKPIKEKCSENSLFPRRELQVLLRCFNACAAVRPPAGLWGEYRPVQPFPADRYGGRGR